jgi:hypothetical protein
MEPSVRHGSYSPTVFRSAQAIRNRSPRTKAESAVSELFETLAAAYGALRLEEYLGGGLVRAAGEDELDCSVQVGLGMSDLLGQRQRVARFHQHMQPPRLDFLAFGLWLFG